MVMPDKAGREPQQPFRIADPAMDQIGPQPPPVGLGQRREARELRVLARIARQGRQPDAALPAEGRQPLDAVGPVAAPAQHARDDECGRR